MLKIEQLRQHMIKLGHDPVSHIGSFGSQGAVVSSYQLQCANCNHTFHMLDEWSTNPYMHCLPSGRSACSVLTCKETIIQDLIE